MIDYRMLWKDGIHLTDDGTKILAAHVLNYLNINVENPRRHSTYIERLMYV